jgi:hypothetical protein
VFCSRCIAAVALAAPTAPDTVSHDDLMASLDRLGEKIDALPDRPAPDTVTVTREKGIHIGAPACFALEEAILPICQAFGAYIGSGGCYVVGSALQRPDWRDVDVRLILSDDDFAREFPGAGEHWEHDTKWLVLVTAISERLSRLTELPIDFQIQPQTHANARHKGRRNAIGIRFAGATDAPPTPTPEET